MAEVWVVRYNQWLHVFDKIETVLGSIKETYKEIEGLEVEAEEISDFAVKFTVLWEERVQDQIYATRYQVCEKPVRISQAGEPYVKVAAAASAPQDGE